MRQELKADDLSWMLVDWGNWKTCRPRERMFFDGEQVHTAPVFESKPPKGVWMTPKFTVIQYLFISEAYARLPDVPHSVVKRVYVDQLPKSAAMKQLGILDKAYASYLSQAHRLIAEWVNLQARAHAGERNAA